MPYVEYLKADANDFDGLIDLIDLVFSNSSPTRFESLLPAQYKERNFMSGANYAVKEDGKIVASVGAYPVDYNVCGDNIKVSAITAVAVHSRTRSKGYMKKLMDMALNDMREDKVDLSFLYGLRQRYEYFGFTPCGVRFDFYFCKHNFQHYFGNNLSKSITFKEADAENADLLDSVYNIYNSEKVYIKRPRERFSDIMSTWENKTFAVYSDDRFIGYISTEKNYGSICEFFIDNIDLTGNVLNAFLDRFDRDDVTVSVFPYEVMLHSYLSKFAESVSINKDGNFYVINYINVIGSFLKLKCEYTKIIDGSLTFNIRDYGNITVSVSNNISSVMFTDEKPDFELSRHEASQLFFSTYSAYSLGPAEGNFFARNLLPIPLFARRLDRS